MKRLSTARIIFFLEAPRRWLTRMGVLEANSRKRLGAKLACKIPWLRKVWSWWVYDKWHRNKSIPSIGYRARYCAKGSENGLLVEECIWASVCMTTFRRGLRKMFAQAADGSRWKMLASRTSLVMPSLSSNKSFDDSCTNWGSATIRKWSRNSWPISTLK